MYFRINEKKRVRCEIVVCEVAEMRCLCGSKIVVLQNRSFERNERSRKGVFRVFQMARNPEREIWMRAINKVVGSNKYAAQHPYFI